MANIILVEDDPDLRDLLALILQDSQHSVLRCENGRRAVEYLSHQDADLLVTDLLMPEMDGVETVRAVRRLRPQLPILAISGGLPNPANYLGIARYFGATRVLPKPFQPAELISAIEELLSSDTAVR